LGTGVARNEQTRSDELLGFGGQCPIAATPSVVLSRDADFQDVRAGSGPHWIESQVTTPASRTYYDRKRGEGKIRSPCLDNGTEILL